MVVLGLIDSKPSSAAILRDGRIEAAIAEERLCRMKLASGMPRAAITEVMRLAAVSPRDVDQVTVAQRVSVFEPNPIPWKGWFKDQELKTRHFDRVSSMLAPLVGRFPLAWKVHHRIKGFLSWERVREIPAQLSREYGITAPVSFFDHHHCHATTAYYTSGFENALVVTLDGGGDGLSGTVYAGRAGRLTRLAAVDSFNSLGNFYSYVTEICGFRAEKDEGKITGLAALGKPAYADRLRKLIRYRDPGRIEYLAPMYHRSALRIIASHLPKPFDPADLAASVQLVLEEIATAFIKYWARTTGFRDIALAGGVFANVKLNQRVHEIEGVDRVFIHPAMDDGGLSVGSALAFLSDPAQGDPARLLGTFANAYLGPEYTDQEIRRAIDAAGFHAERPPDIHRAIAGLLAQGRVVARFSGRMEYGPRALGNRSIMYRASDVSVNDWLNQRLRRTEFMPFAPATLHDHADDLFVGVTGAADAARFMTITFSCTPRMRAESPGVVHVDGTARPQLVDPETAPDFHAILRAYHELTGVPTLVNTSFNMHEEPIVCSPEDALRAFSDGRLEYLAIGDWLVEHPDVRVRV